MTLVHDDAPGCGPGEWTEGIDERVVCTRIQDVTHDVKSFALARPGGAPLAFEPGQYLTVTVPVAGGPLQRCYTISSPPTPAEELTLTVKRVPGGPVSNWWHDRMAVGDSLHVSGPYGRFSLAQHPASAYLFLSAGSGITPGMSMVRMLRDIGDPADVVVVHSARTPQDIVFRGELEDLAERPGFEVAAICEADSPDEPWGGRTGRLTLRTLLRLAPDLHRREVFTCGPPGYMASVREMLATAGADPARCHEESFDLAVPGPAVAAAPPAVSGAPARRTHTVAFRRSGRTIECGSGESILGAALRAGLRPPSMCGEGFCGTCKTSLLSGEVDMQHTPGIRPKEVAGGKVLLCCSQPLGHVEVDA